MTLLLINEGAIGEPLLYLSLYLKRNRDRYYELRQRVRTDGEWLPWTRFFLEGVRETAAEATTTARSIMSLLDGDHKRVRGIGRAASSALRVHDHLRRKPLTSVTGKERGRVYAYSRYLEVLGEGA